ncbi:MAG TPA: 50S ribosomal protein L3 [Leptospiraceae bacterium]|jgi:large subunit ribosomal protein L3|nr:50S ribosomal protein L3 [Leptospirales bacterium]HMU85209.1 50S ribosomal protein L3 [Leptospiraceae bacterium]HMX58495.1 50S ribosomal protein L3 [Leptospiraceae bacterium]HMZ35545.1 50S ribosomal protein L3 [Leptospiraceae bacterium]HNE22916.1 50S ribosomal protein L3 [Leptospiraceae bacterium]
MATGLLAKKIGMTQIYDETGKLFPVSVLRAGPCVVSQVKTVEKDGYAAVQIGFDALREKLLSKGEIGHFKKAGIAPQRILAEFRDMEGQSGQEINVSVFNAGDTVRVTGISKGKGFQGSMKRHGFGGGPAAHGSKFHRAPGSLGANTFPAEVWRGKRMPGRTGGDQITLRNVKIVAVDAENNLLFVKGAVPGARTALLRIEVTK